MPKRTTKQTGSRSGSRKKSAGGRAAASPKRGTGKRGAPAAAGQSSGKSRVSPAKVSRPNAKETGTSSKTAPRAAESKASAADATAMDPIQFPEQEKLPKTHLSAKELREFREMLLAKRVELVGDVEGLAGEALSRDGRSHGDQSAMPIHMADLGSDNWEQEFTLGLLASERALVREIDEALARIADKTYGICLATHQPIGVARLRAQPWAKYCIEYARAREEGRAL